MALVSIQAGATGALERHNARRALASEQLEVEAAPEGKRISFVRVVRYDVFQSDEALGAWLPLLNMFHWRTKASLVDDELRVRAGQIWDEARLTESLRNLRDRAIFTVVTPVAVKTGTPDEVGLLLVTRDLWSLRFEQVFQVTGRHIDALTLQMTERNLLGRGHLMTMRYDLQAATWAAGVFLRAKRPFGSSLQVRQEGDVFFRRNDGEYDGFKEKVVVERPLYNLDQRWGFRVPVEVERRTIRQTQGGEVLSWDDPETVAEEAVPRAWVRDYVSASASAQRQWPGARTGRLSAGVGFAQLKLGTDDVRQGHEASFRAEVGLEDQRWIYPFVSYELFEPRYRAFHDLATFGVSEDVRLGPSLTVALTLPLAALGSDGDTVIPSVGLKWAEAFAGDGLVEGAVAGDARYTDGLVDQRVLLRARLASPRTRAGRAIVRADWVRRAKSTTNPLVTLGGNNGLRGYASDMFYGFGASKVRGNAEWRTPAWQTSLVHVGGVAFYDAGEVYTNADDFELRQSVGVGVRVLFPHFSRSPYRFDFGVPTDGRGFTVLLSVGSEQAVPMPGREDGLQEMVVGGVMQQP